jgi:hypothetical protein
MAQNWWENDQVVTQPSNAGWWSADEIDGVTPFNPEYDLPSEHSVMGTPYRDAFRNQFGQYPEQTDMETGAPFNARVRLGASETLSEKQDVLRNTRGLPDTAELQRGPNGDYFYRLNAEDKWKAVNPKGPDWGDVGELGGAIPELVGGTAALLSSKNPSMLLGTLRATLGGGAGQTLEEGGESLAGYEFNSESIPQAALFEGGGYLGGSLIAKPIAVGLNAVRGTTIQPSAEVLQAYQRIQNQFGKGDFPDLMPQQLVPDNEILRRTAMQARAASDDRVGIAGREADQDAFALDELNKLRPTRANAELLGDVQAGLQGYRDEAFQGIVGRSGIPIATSDTVGRSVKGGVTKDWLEQSRKAVEKRYESVGQAAREENPVFDLTNVKDTARELRRGIEGTSTEVTERATGQMDVITGKPITRTDVDVTGVRVSEMDSNLASVLRDIEKLDPQQASYEVIKQLRTRLGKAYESYLPSFSEGGAKRLYSELTNSLRNPINSASTPKYLRSIQEANEAARKRFSVLEKSSVRKLFADDDVFAIGSRITQPGGLTDDVYEALRASGRLGDLKAGVAQNIFKQDNPARTLRMWDQDAPEMLGKLFNKTELKVMRETTAKLNALYSEPGQQMLNKLNANTASVRDLLNNSGFVNLERTVSAMERTNPGARQALKEAVYMDFLERAVVNRGGKDVIDRKVFNELFAEYEKAGALKTLMNKTDIERLRALDDYLRLTNKVMPDTGSSLAVAEDVAKMTHALHSPKRAVEGGLNLYVKARLSKFLASPAGHKVLLRGMEKEPYSLGWMKSLGLLLGSLEPEQGNEQ